MRRSPGDEVVIVVSEEPVYHQPRKEFLYAAIQGCSYAIHSSRQAKEPRRLPRPFASSERQVVFRQSKDHKQLLPPAGLKPPESRDSWYVQPAPSIPSRECQEQVPC